MKKTLFKEEQKANQPWVWLVLIPVATGTILLFSHGLNLQIVQGIPFGDNPLSDTGLIVVSIFSMLIMLGVTLLFYKMKLVTRIGKEGVFYKFPPFISKWKVIPKKDIRKYEVRIYKPIREYGGWGMRTGKKGAGKAFNMSGNIGLQLYLNDGTRVLIGTRKKKQMVHAMKKLMSTDYKHKPE